jgi:hypothetical protein
VARLSATEFRELIGELVDSEGLGKLQEKLIRSHAVISRRRLGSADALSRQLHQLTVGLDRECLPTQVVIALWEEFLRGKLAEESAAGLEQVAERINACLNADGSIDSAKQADILEALVEYRTTLAAMVGERAARLTMLTRAVPAVAALLRVNS